MARFLSQVLAAARRCLDAESRRQQRISIRTFCAVAHYWSVPPSSALRRVDDAATPLSAALTTTEAAGMVDRVRRAAVHAASLLGHAASQGTVMLQRVSGVRYADDMLRLVSRAPVGPVGMFQGVAAFGATWSANCLAAYSSAVIRLCPCCPSTTPISVTSPL